MCVSRQGQVIEQLAVGEASDGQPMTEDSIALWMSSGKPVTAVAILQLVEHGEIELDDAVAAYLPTFAAHGKQAITVRHLLTHTAGIRTARFKFPADDWGAIIAAICDAPPETDWEPGEQGGYHTQTSWFLLGELVRLVDGRAIDRYVREMITPLSIRCPEPHAEAAAAESVTMELRDCVLKQPCDTSPRCSRSCHTVPRPRRSCDRSSAMASVPMLIPSLTRRITFLGIGRRG